MTTIEFAFILLTKEVGLGAVRCKLTKLELPAFIGLANVIFESYCSPLRCRSHNNQTSFIHRHKPIVQHLAEPINYYSSPNLLLCTEN